jgi:hypothetical protein
MSITISDDQLRELEIAAGTKWNKCRIVLGIEQVPAPPEPEPPAVSGFGTYHREKAVKQEIKHEDQGRQVQESLNTQREGQGSGYTTSGPDRIDGYNAEGEDAGRREPWFKGNTQQH